jgi:hypothetical protein
LGPLVRLLVASGLVKYIIAVVGTGEKVAEYVHALLIVADRASLLGGPLAGAPRQPLLGRRWNGQSKYRKP